MGSNSLTAPDSLAPTGFRHLCPPVTTTTITLLSAYRPFPLVYTSLFSIGQTFVAWKPSESMVYNHHTGPGTQNNYNASNQYINYGDHTNVVTIGGVHRELFSLF